MLFADFSTDDDNPLSNEESIVIFEGLKLLLEKQTSTRNHTNESALGVI
ncbi:MAG: hypothetical protein ACPH9O_09650 [Akkermansiaceae bacterium]